MAKRPVDWQRFSHQRGRTLTKRREWGQPRRIETMRPSLTIEGESPCSLFNVLHTRELLALLLRGISLSQFFLVGPVFLCVCVRNKPSSQWAHRPMKSRHNLLHTWLRLHKRSLALKTWLSPWWTRIKGVFFIQFFFPSSLILLFLSLLFISIQHVVFSLSSFHSHSSLSAYFCDSKMLFPLEEYKNPLDKEKFILLFDDSWMEN